VDDYGRFDGRISVIWGSCFSLRQDATPDKVKVWIGELSEAGLIKPYSADDKPFIQITKWQERARGASKYPSPPGAESEGEAVGTIYLIQGEDSRKIKIGFTQWDVESRCRRLQTGSSEVLKVIAHFPGTLREERAIHRKFAHLNCGGEWFNFHAEIIAFAGSRSGCAQSAGNICTILPPSPQPSPQPSSSPAAETKTQGPFFFGATEPEVEDESPEDSDELWVKSLSSDPTYEGIDVLREYGKCSNWCAANHKKPTRRRFINWLNKVEKPMQFAPPQQGPTAARAASPQVQKMAVEELIASHVANRDSVKYRKDHTVEDKQALDALKKRRLELINEIARSGMPQ
jgi:hypothetical protein